MSYKAIIAFAAVVALCAPMHGQNSQGACARSIVCSDVLPKDALIPVRTERTIDIRIPSDGRIFRGIVAEDVFGRGGTLLIPRGANAELIVQNTGRNEGSVDLESIEFDGRRYMVD